MRECVRVWVQERAKHPQKVKRICMSGFCLFLFAACCRAFFFFFFFLLLFFFFFFAFFFFFFF